MGYGCGERERGIEGSGGGEGGGDRRGGTIRVNKQKGYVATK